LIRHIAFQEQEPVAAKLPPIVLSADDVERLEQLSDKPELRHEPAIAHLLSEIARARVLPANQVPSDVVTMNSSVICLEAHTGAQRRLTLVYPHEADIAHGRVSVLSPVGTALLGLRVGQSIDWPARTGHPIRLTVTNCAALAESAP
jgi:regulator of nucleoside diphosphate kinase